MNEQEQQIRIAIVDDHEMFRAGVIATLQPHFDIVGAGVRCRGIGGDDRADEAECGAA